MARVGSEVRDARVGAGGRGGLKRVDKKRIIVHAVILVLLAILPVFVNHVIGYAPLLCYAFALALGFAYVRLLRGEVQVSVDDGEEGISSKDDENFVSCERPSNCDVSFLIQNKCSLPLMRACLEIEVFTPGAHERATAVTDQAEILRSYFSLGSRGVATHVQPVYVEHVGVYAVRASGVVIYDPLGFVSVHVPIACEQEIVCTPTLEQADLEDVEQVIMRESEIPERSVISDGFDYAGVREYAFGDPIKSVHWKLSARHEGLQTRLFEIDMNKRVAVLLDFHGMGADAIEHAFGNTTEHVLAQYHLHCNDAIVECGLACAVTSVENGVETVICYGRSANDYTHDHTHDSKTSQKTDLTNELRTDLVNESSTSLLNDTLDDSANKPTASSITDVTDPAIDVIFKEPPTSADLASFTKSLPHVSSNESAMCAVDALSACVGTKSGYDNIIICTSVLTHALIDSVSEINATCATVTVIQVVPECASAQIRKDCDARVSALTDSGVQCVQVKSVADLCMEVCD